MARVDWTPAAEQDLQSIFLFISREQQSPQAAAAVIREIFEKADLYAEQPLLAAARPEFGKAVRAYYVHRYVIFYRPTDAGVAVLRVIHGSRDVFGAFRQQTP